MLTLNTVIHYWQLKYLPVLLIKIERIQIGNHRIKVVYFADDNHHVLKTYCCFNRILHEDSSSAKINFSKAKSYGQEHMNIELINKEE